MLAERHCENYPPSAVGNAKLALRRQFVLPLLFGQNRFYNALKFTSRRFSPRQFETIKVFDPSAVV
jgi:hypothetical protein